VADSLVDLAVVVVTHNVSRLLAECLSSLESGGLRGATARIWVVDNASEDDTRAVVERRFPSVELIVSDTNVGYAAANNLALKKAGFADLERRGDMAIANFATAPQAKHALLLNPDTVVPEGALASLLGYLEEEPDIGIVGPKLVRPDGSLDLACRRSFPTPEVAAYRFSGLSRAFPGSPRFGRYNMTYLDPDTPTDVDSVVGACMMVRGEAILRVGLLDESFWMYGEDLDWALRIKTAGWRTVYRPQVVVEHVKRASSAGSDRAHYEFQRAMWLFFEKHYAAITPWPVTWAVRLSLMARGGRRLAREMREARRTV
jgi:GT2 family glycosyltransferase